MLGIIGIEELEIPCIIGVYPYEREAEQKIIIDLKVEMDVAKAGLSDDLNDTLDYCRLKELIQALSRNRYKLIEALAHDIVEQLLAEMPITWVWIRVKKPQAMHDAKYTFIELEQFKAGSFHEVDAHHRFSQTARR